MKISSATILWMTAVACFGCARLKSDVASTAPASATNTIAKREVRQQCLVKDSTDVVTFFRDGSVELTTGGKTVSGSLRPAMPEAAELTFPGASPKSPSRTIWAWKRYDHSVTPLMLYESNYTELVYWPKK